VSDHLEEMLVAQRALQARIGYDLAALTTRDRVAYAKEMYIALVVELTEALNETSWKSWARGDRFNDDAFFGECIDMWHIMLNMMLVAQPHLAAAELVKLITTRYLAKNKINHQRQDAGYDGVSTKCVGCGRALDDPATRCLPADKTLEPGHGWCAELHDYVPATPVA